ncbi:MAG TPA: hypothetical protein EYQ79_04905 [Flavobacteriaceae bacterium]|nr:hypothetical protein [Flavobacteriaceae bacterium]
MFKQFFYFLSFFFIMNSFSQNNEIGVFIGNSNYIGDVGPTTYVNPFQNPNYVFGVLFRKNFSNRIAGRFSFNYSDIGSSDNWKSSVDYRKQRGKYFKNTISEISLGVDFNFFEFDLMNDALQMTPYVHTGINYLRYNALHYPIGMSQARKYGENSTFSIPITIGYKIKPFSNIILGLEVRANHSFTDNLDGSYPQYKNMELYSQKAFGANLSQDWYVFTGFTLTYIFGDQPCYCPK